ncbi:MAG: hypothetical protein NTY01_04540, partial [Verrucomicrobia bacterium]|nr:hypothetical protein [Verrucomicrobiota bacterium]
KEQATKDRGGEVLFFQASDRVKAMEASSKAYPGATLYRRTSLLVDHGGGRNYVVDFFRVEGGKRQDYVYHGFKAEFQISDLKSESSQAPLYDFKNIRAADGAAVWRATWKCGAGMTCVAWNVGQRGEQAFVADGWGQRDWKNSDIGATIPYIIRRCEGEGVKAFISVFEGHEGGPFVRGVKRLDPSGVLLVETALGCDYVMSALDTGTLEAKTAAGAQRITGHFAVVSVQNGKVAWKFVREK